MAIIYSVLKVYPFPGTLARDCRLLLGLCFLGGEVSMLTGIFWLPTFSAPSLGYMRQKENPGKLPVCCYLYSELPSQSASVYLSVFLYYIYAQIWFEELSWLGRNQYR